MCKEKKILHILWKFTTQVYPDPVLDAFFETLRAKQPWYFSLKYAPKF